MPERADSWRHYRWWLAAQEVASDQATPTEDRRMVPASRDPAEAAHDAADQARLAGPGAHPGPWWRGARDEPRVVLLPVRGRAFRVRLGAAPAVPRQVRGVHHPGGRQDHPEAGPDPRLPEDDPT